VTVKQAHLSAMHADAPSAAAMPSGEIYTAAMAWRARVSRYQIQIALTALAAFAVPFDLFYRLILFHFYVRGSFPYDTGLLAALMWHNSIALNLPVSLGGMSFFSQHVAPLLILVSAVSEVLPLSMAQLFAGFTGVCHGLLALAVFWLLVGGFGMRRGWKLALAGVIAVAFAVNGQAIAIARYPHFEAFAAASLLPIGVDYDPGRIGVPEAFLRPPSAEQQVLTDRAIAAIAAGRPALGRLVADSSVVALLPDGFARDEMAGLATGSPDTVVFFANGFDAGRLAAVPGLPVRYVVPGTAIQIMTNRSEATLRDLAIAR
jgi:hypothetical protein